MLPLHSYLVLAAFIVLGIALLIQVLRLRGAGLDFLGSPPIEKLYFYTGKVGLFLPWGLFILKAIKPELGYFNEPDLFSWTAVGFLYAGSLLLIVAFFRLGRSLKVGLPDQATSLQTRGIYRLTRNPIYIGAFLVSVGSCIYFPDLVNVTFTVYAIVIHHQVILQEERFLSARFGADWDNYRARVRRYI